MAEPTFDYAAALKDRVPDADPDLAMAMIAGARLGRILEWDLERTAHLGGLERSEHSVLTILSGKRRRLNRRTPGSRRSAQVNGRTGARTGVYCVLEISLCAWAVALAFDMSICLPN
jgi:hypothetical protein